MKNTTGNVSHNPEITNISNIIVVLLLLYDIKRFLGQNINYAHSRVVMYNHTQPNARGEEYYIYLLTIVLKTISL